MGVNTWNIHSFLIFWPSVFAFAQYGVNHTELGGGLLRGPCPEVEVPSPSGTFAGWAQTAGHRLGKRTEPGPAHMDDATEPVVRAPPGDSLLDTATEATLPRGLHQDPECQT